MLPFDSTAAGHYAEVVGDRDHIGLSVDGFDAQIASICRAHGAALATRNLKDFEHTDVTPPSTHGIRSADGPSRLAVVTRYNVHTAIPSTVLRDVAYTAC